MPTERLYYADSHLQEFTARVKRIDVADGGCANVVLDRTAFYPIGGGQPSDTGTLGGAGVVACVANDKDEIIHTVNVTREIPFAIGDEIAGCVDWARRFDHIQQHTAQHILSRAFLELHAAPTAGFRMMEAYSEVDIKLGSPSDASIREALTLANNIVWENRAVRLNYMTPEELTVRGVRQRFERAGTLRVVEIEGFDFNPCGGTHAHRTGEVGIILIPSWERAKGMTRLTFVAGGRALRDYEQINSTARSVALKFGVGRDEAAHAVERLMEEHKALSRRTREIEEALSRTEARELIETAEISADKMRVVAHVSADRDAESLKRLAAEIIKHERTIALLASTEADAARLVFARSADAHGDMNTLMREACATLDGRGGGRPDMAQGGGTRPDNLHAALAAAKHQVLNPTHD